MRADIETTAVGTGRIALDGVDISKGVRAFRLSAEVGEVTRLDLDVLLLHPGPVGVDEVEVEIPAATHDLLVQLGWTPPAGAE